MKGVGKTNYCIIQNKIGHSQFENYIKAEILVIKIIYYYLIYFLFNHIFKMVNFNL